MNFSDRISNQATIYYSQGRYNRQQSNKLSRSPKRQKQSKESTKTWVTRAFYSNPTRPGGSSSSVADPKPLVSTAGDVKPPVAAATLNDDANTSAGDSGKKNTHLGKPAIYFERSQIDSQSENFKFCLIGKFPGWRPSLSQSRNWVATKWKLKGEWSITLLDHRHVLIRLHNEEDMLHLWPRNRWFIGGHLMRVFKWFPTFVPANGEPSSAAIWVSLPSLPLAFFGEELLLPIASLAGKVLAVDGPTRDLSRTDLARVCVEVDLLKELPRQVWIGIGEGGFWQDLCYQRLPSFCSNCREQGHSINDCQAKRIGTGSQTTTLKWTKKKNHLNSHIKEDTGTNVYSGQSKRRVRISPSPIVIDDHGSEQPIRQASSHSSLLKNVKGKQIVESRGDSTSDDSSTRLPFGYSGKERQTDATLPRGECSYTTKIDQTSSAEYPKGVVNQGIDVTGKERESSAQAVTQRSPQRRKKFTSKMLNVIWRSKQRGGDLKSSTQPILRLDSVNTMSLTLLTKFKYSEIVGMTHGFRDVLGRGGFGTVYRGMLPNGQEFAVKVMSQASCQGEKEFLQEIQILKNTRHANIIRLLGCCSEGSNRILVSEFMRGGSLNGIIHQDERILTSAEKNRQLCEIAIGTARGLKYLHHGCYPPILHLDVKPQNILLDEQLRPKLTDFGISHISLGSSSYSDTTTLVRGTPGYLAPEFYVSNKVSGSADVYSYGITLLQMATGRKAVSRDEISGDLESILHWVRQRVTATGEIRGFTMDEGQKKMIVVGLWCTQKDPDLRPSFRRVIQRLEGTLDELCREELPYLLTQFGSLIDPYC